MNNPLTIFSITNGRSTHDHSLKALYESVEIDCPIVVIRDMKWLDALNRCVEVCKTPWFLRVDDDMIVHPKAVAYMLNKARQKNHFGLMYFHLWEDCTQRVRQSIKVYNRDALRAIGGFKENPQTGKVDGCTNSVLIEAGHPMLDDISVVALHICGTWEEQERYESFWNGLAVVPYSKTNRKAVKLYCGTKTLEEQCEMRGTFLYDLNQKRKSGFGKWLRRNPSVLLSPSVSKHRTICEDHKIIADLLLINMHDRPKALEEILPYLQSAYTSGINIVKTLIEHKLSLPEWRKNNQERVQALRKERLQLMDELQKKGQPLLEYTKKKKSSNDLTIFSITNGKNTHTYSLKALCESVGINRPIVVIHDMGIRQAMNHCLDICETPLFLKVDDDMIVHPKAVAYMLYRSLQVKNLGAVYFHLWEDCTQRVRQSIKVYNRDALRAIGGFKSDPKTGRVDACTNGPLEHAGYPMVEDKSVVALHACGSWKAQERYEKLWSDMAIKAYHKPNRKDVKMYCLSHTLEDEFALRTTFLTDLNRKLSTDFSKWLKTSKEGHLLI